MKYWNVLIFNIIHVDTSHWMNILVYSIFFLPFSPLFLSGSGGRSIFNFSFFSGRFYFQCSCCHFGSVDVPDDRSGRFAGICVCAWTYFQWNKNCRGLFLQFMLLFAHISFSFFVVSRYFRAEFIDRKSMHLIEQKTE